MQSTNTQLDRVGTSRRIRLHLYKNSVPYPVVLTKPQIKSSFTVRYSSQNAMKLAGYGVAQIVERRLAVRQAHVRISVRQPSVVDLDLLVGNADPDPEPGAWKLTKIK